MGTSLLNTENKTVSFDYYLQDSEGNEWQIRVDAEVTPGSPMELDEAGIPYPGCRPEATIINSYWCKSDGEYIATVRPNYLPPLFLDAIEAKAIRLGHEQSEFS